MTSEKKSAEDVERLSPTPGLFFGDFPITQRIRERVEWMRDARQFEEGRRYDVLLHPLDWREAAGCLAHNGTLEIRCCERSMLVLSDELGHVERGEVLVAWRKPGETPHGVRDEDFERMLAG
jgi:hypothetical protein